MNTNPTNLHSKFHPYLLGHASCSANFKNEIDEIVEKPVTELKSNVVDAGKWILKVGRRDGLLTTEDTHLYRIRKAEKIRSYIRENGLEASLAVPKKYLYWNEKQGEFYVVSEKLDLSPEVAKPRTKELEDEFKAACGLGWQAKALSEGKPMRAFTPVQAKALAELSFLGYTDLSYNNLYFTKEGKVAIIDTEPQKRGLKKAFAENLVIRYLRDKSSLLTEQSVAGIAKLKLSVSDPLALKEIEQVEKSHVLWNLAQLVGKIAILSLAIYFVPAATALVPIAEVSTVLKIFLISIGILKVTFLALNTGSVYTIWKQSCQGPEGVVAIFENEKAGIY